MNIIPRFGKNVTSVLFNYTKRTYTTPTTSNIPPTNPSVNPSFESNTKIPLSDFRKFLCVWAKRYPSMKDVPDHVNPEVWGKVRSIMRIKVANYTMVLILAGCLVMVITGKQARDRGESIMQRNLEWHQKYSEGKEEEVKNIGVFGK